MQASPPCPRRKQDSRLTGHVPRRFRHRHRHHSRIQGPTNKLKIPVVFTLEPDKFRGTGTIFHHAPRAIEQAVQKYSQMPQRQTLSFVPRTAHGRAGFLSRRSRPVGEAERGVSGGHRVAVLSPMWVNFSLSENELERYRDQVEKGQIIPPPDREYAVDVVLADGSLFPNSGRITFAAPSYHAKTGTFMLRASVNNPKGLLRPNQYASRTRRCTVKSGEERFRPIIMTSLAFIVGVLPLAIAKGAGANARHSIGTGIMGGMIGEATLAMLYVPLFFYIFDRLAERKKKPEPETRPGAGPPERPEAAPEGGE